MYMQKTFWPFRILLFYAGIIPATILFSCMGLFFILFPLKVRYWFITRWSYFFILWAKITCGLKYHVEGLENIPNTASVVVANHQSTWETIFMQTLLPRQSWVLKRELLWIPFFGWGLALLSPIAVNRSNKFSVKSLLFQGTAKLREGSWILIYPEGTRVAYGKNKAFKKTASSLAIAAHTPILPIVHNAGKFWPRGPWPTKPGTITIKIGKAIPNTNEQNVADLTNKLEQWINTEKNQI